MEKKYELCDLQHELECVATTLSAVAYGITDNTEVDFTKTSIQDILFGICNHIDRIATDIENYDEA